MWVKILLLFFVFSFLFRTDHSFDQDLGRHIKLGEIIWQTKTVPKTNLFSYTNPDFPFINTHWLFEVLAYFFSQSLGLQSLLFLKIIIFLLSVWLIFKTIPKEKSAFLLPIGFIFLHVLRERLELRPEIFSFLFTSLSLFILEKYLKVSTKLIFLLPFIQFIWINTHIYFFVGLILQGIYLLNLSYQYLRLHLGRGLIAQEGVKLKILGSIFLLSVLVSLINPNGLDGFLYPLNVTKNYGYTIVENQTMFLLESINFKDPNFIFVKLSIGIILLSFLIVTLNVVKNLRSKFRDPSLITQVASLFGFALALMNVRSFPYLVFLSLPVTVINFSLLKVPKTVNNIVLTIFTAMLLLQSFSYLNGQYYKENDSDFSVRLSLVEKGKPALDFLIKNDLPNPIFNNFDIGSYIIYRGFPKYQVFVDGRPESYPKEFFQNTYIPMQSDYSKFKAEDQKRGFKTVIFSHTDQTPWGRNFLQSIVKDENWKLVYIDDFILILVKNEVLLEKKLVSVNLSEITPSMYDYKNHVSYLRIGYFLLTTQNIKSGNSFLQKAAQIYPQSPTLQLFL